MDKTESIIYALDFRTGNVHVIKASIPDNRNENEYIDKILKKYGVDHDETAYMIAYSDSEVLFHDYDLDKKPR